LLPAVPLSPSLRAVVAVVTVVLAAAVDLPSLSAASRGCPFIC